ncbi:uncharacterized [Tachysurus ichikawai]
MFTQTLQLDPDVGPKLNWLLAKLFSTLLPPPVGKFNYSCFDHRMVKSSSCLGSQHGMTNREEKSWSFRNSPSLEQD